MDDLQDLATPPIESPLTRTDKGRILIVDDTYVDSSITVALLQDHGYETKVTRSAAETLETLGAERFDLVCLDAQLPDVDGFALTRRIRESLSYGHLPILMVSAEFTEEANVVQGLEAGANDYVRVPFAHQEFVGRVDGLVRLKMAEDRLRALTREDLLTHLGNRTFFFQRGVEEMSRAVRHKAPLSLALMDIDHLQLVNDTHGHLAGDEVLCGVAALLHESVRREDTAFRWGGDEFALLLVEVGTDGAKVVIDRICESVAHTNFAFSDKDIHVSLSIGLGMFDPAVHKNIDDFVAEVDRALLRAKESGGAQIVLSTEPEA